MVFGTKNEMEIGRNRQTRRGKRGGAAGFVLVALCAAATISGGPEAKADVVGYLRLHVLNATDGKPIEGARVVISDTAHIRPSWTLTTDKRGEAISVPLENRNWQLVRVTLPDAGGAALPVSANHAADAKQATVTKAAVTKAAGKRAGETGAPIDLSPFRPEQRQIRIVADTTTEASLLIDTSRKRLARAQGTGKEVFVSQVGTIMRRDQAFIQTYPVNPGNPQSLGSVLQTVPRLSGRAAGRPK